MQLGNQILQKMSTYKKTMEQYCTTIAIDYLSSPRLCNPQQQQKQRKTTTKGKAYEIQQDIGILHL